MPTIRRPSWRPRTIHGYDVESYKTNDNWELELNSQFRNSDLAPEARAMLLRLRLDIWFIRLPVGHRHIATLIKIDAKHRPTKELLDTLKGEPPIYINDEYRARRNGQKVLSDFVGYIMYGIYYYSFVDGKVKEYINGNPEWLWDAVRDYMYWDGVSREDQAALAAIEL